MTPLPTQKGLTKKWCAAHVDAVPQKTEFELIHINFHLHDIPCREAVTAIRGVDTITAARSTYTAPAPTATVVADTAKALLHIPVIMLHTPEFNLLLSFALKICRLRAMWLKGCDTVHRYATE